MSQQNLLGIGFNVEELSAEAQQVLSIVQNLYSELKKYDGMKISPINASGLSELVTATKAQQIQMEDLQVTLVDLATALRTYNQVAKDTANINAKIATSESDVAKANAAAKVELAERTRMNKEEAQSNNQLYQDKQAKRKQEIADAKYESDFKKLLAEEERANAKETAVQVRTAAQEKRQADAEYIRMWKELLAEKDKAERQSAANSKALQAERSKQAVVEGKNALALNDWMKQLESKKKHLETMLVNAKMTNQPETVIKSLTKQLTYVNERIGDMDKMLDKAGSSGARSLGKALSENLSLVRNLAYILPGIGLAGIFNLAFEAIGKAVESLGWFVNKTDRAIESEKALADAMQDVNNVLKERSDIFTSYLDADVQYYQNVVKSNEAAGLSYDKQFTDIDNLNKANKEQADERVSSLHAEYSEIGQLNSKILEINGQKEKVTNKLISLEKDLQKEENRTLTRGEVLFGGQLQKTGKVNALKELKETFTKQLEVLNQQSENAKTRLTDVSGALKAQSLSNANIDNEQQKRSKFLSDETRKQLLNNAKLTYEGIKSTNEAILKNQLSTEQQKLDAVKAIQDAQDKYAFAQMVNITENVSSTAKERAIAIANFNKAVIENDKDAREKTIGIELDFWLKHTELVHQSQQIDITIQQLTDKTIMDNEQETYDKRIQALTDYTNDREQLVYNQYQKDLEVARATLSGDLLGEKEVQLKKEYQKQILDIENGLRKEAYNITESWFKKQLDLIKNYTDKNRTAVETGATQELIDLEIQFKNKEITYKTYAKRRQAIEAQSDKNISDAKIQDDKNEINRLKGLRQDALGKFTLATTMAIFAPSKKAKDEQLGIADAAKEEYDNLGKVIGDKEKEQSNDELNNLKLKNKAKEDMIKQTNENWTQLEKEAFDGAKQVADSYFEHRINQLQHLTEEQDKATESEIEAINRSSIAQKDKNAYEIQLNAHNTSRDEQAALQEKKIKHEKAVFDKEVSMSQIVLNTAIAVTGALAQSKDLGPLAVGLAISYGALGAAQLAIAAATKIPEYAKGGIHTKEGLALFGEAGAELVKEPHKKPYIADKPIIAHLSAGTELIPLYEIPQFPERKNDSWAQTLYLGKQIAKSKREIKNIFKPRINVDLGSELYKHRILHG